jgi:trehalose 6-phosphate synthase/phosphatase
MRASPLAGGGAGALAGHLAAAVRSGRSLALFLDYDGTLRDFTPRPEEAVPDPGLVPLLVRLAGHPAVRVTVVSGRQNAFLEEHFGGGPIALVAEHGYRWKLPGGPGWELVDPRVDTSWKDVIRPHLQQAADLTPGSSVEEKLSSIVWHYRRTDPEFGLWRARGLLDELTAVTANLPVSVHHGKKIVEVASQLVNKGVAVSHLLSRWAPDLALAAGDDQTDETMFAIDPGPVEFFTVIVGTSSSRAAHRTDIPGLRALLGRLAEDILT